MDILEQAEAIAKAQHIQTLIFEAVATWKAGGVLQEIAVHREWAIVQIAIFPEITALLINGNATLEQLQNWLNEAISLLARA